MALSQAQAARVGGVALGVVMEKKRSQARPLGNKMAQLRDDIAAQILLAFDDSRQAQKPIKMLSNKRMTLEGQQLYALRANGHLDETQKRLLSALIALQQMGAKVDVESLMIGKQ